ncbi:MAG: helix-turn-helix transcriptional regulator [Deltaproteobacteria bacterium]|nr:helix-turn-helix transcriptional regulator [Deltaproteobacteria bacterium]
MDQETCKKVLARLSKGLAHPARVEIIRMLSNQYPETKYICSDIVKTLPLAQASVSQHLKILKETGWVYGEMDGPRVRCSLVENIMEYYGELLRKATRK